jgi:haloalkane dehalogenase
MTRPAAGILLTEGTVKGHHFVQVDSPDEIGQAVADFVRRVRSQ